MTAIATTVAFACGLIAGLPQIVRMVRGRNSSSQSAVGWAIGANGAAATAYVGVAEGTGVRELSTRASPDAPGGSPRSELSSTRPQHPFVNSL